jgi:hypothetical protein
LHAGKLGQEHRLRHLILTGCTLRGNWSGRTNAPFYQRRYPRSAWPKVLIYTGNFSAWRSPPFRLDSLANARLRDAGKLVEDVTSISCKSVAAVAENRKGQKTPRNPPRSSWVQPAKFFPYPSHLVTSFAFCESTSASKPFRRFLEVLLATIGTRRSRDREPICGAFSREPGPRGYGCASDRLSGAGFRAPLDRGFRASDGAAEFSRSSLKPVCLALLVQGLQNSAYFVRTRFVQCPRLCA